MDVTTLKPPPKKPRLPVPSQPIIYPAIYSSVIVRLDPGAVDPVAVVVAAIVIALLNCIGTANSCVIPPSLVVAVLAPGTRKTRSATVVPSVTDALARSNICK